MFCNVTDNAIIILQTAAYETDIQVHLSLAVPYRLEPTEQNAFYLQGPQTPRNIAPGNKNFIQRQIAQHATIELFAVATVVSAEVILIANFVINFKT